MGLAVVGGLVVSQLLTLFITPVFYTYMEQARGLFGRFRARKEKQGASAVPVEIAFKG
jgi:HAE1 family hydrophobic/amphiphilic exporter-1